MPDTKRWYSKGIKYLCHLYDAQGFKTFQQLRPDFDLPRSYLFHYYQLRHAIRAQFGSLKNPTNLPPLERLLRQPDPNKLISTYYAALTTDVNPRFSKAQEKWTSMDISFTEEDWTEFRDTYKATVISSRDRVIQIKFFHHSHLTPARLHKMGLKSSAECFRGCGGSADIMHCFWTCPVVQDFWVEVGSFISSALGLPNIIHPKNGLLGIFGDLQLSSQAKRLLRILYFYVRKAILLSWKGIQTPLKSLWLKLINDVIPLYRLTFELRKRSKTFHKIWGRWLASPLTLTL